MGNSAYPFRHFSWGLTGAILLFLAVPVAALRPGEAEQQVAMLSDNAAQREIRNQSAFAVILGEFRTNISDLIFIKTERYLHNGVAYEPHLDMTEMEKSGSIQAHSSHDHASHEGHDHSSHGGEELKPVIADAEGDFRGFVGNLEREVKPYLEPGSPDFHTSGTELLPWYRLATLGNPRNQRAYMVGAWWLKSLDTEEQTQQAIDFLNEGIANNPKAFQLYLMRGYLQRQLEDEDSAFKSFLSAGELAAKLRPPAGQISADWTEYLEEQAGAAQTMSVLSTRDKKGPAAALELVREYEQAMKGISPMLQRIKADLQRMIEEEAAEQ